MIRISLFILSCLIIGCSTSKEASSNKRKKIKKENIIAHLNNSHINFETFYAKCQTNYSSDIEERNFKATFKIKKDSIIWVSVTAILGIEVLKAIILTDSIIVVDKFNNKYFTGNINYLDTLFNISPNFKTIQSVITNQPLIDFTKKYHFKTNEKNYTFDFYNKKDSIQKLVIINENLYPELIKIYDKKNELSISYNNYRSLEKNIFPHNIILNTKSNKKLNLDVDYLKIKLNQKLNFSIEIPKEYVPMF